MYDNITLFYYCRVAAFERGGGRRGAIIAFNDRLARTAWTPRHKQSVSDCKSQCVGREIETSRIGRGALHHAERLFR